MQKRTSRNFLNVLFLIISSCFISFINGQTRISDPYSRFGIGDIQNSISAENVGMCGIKYAYRSPFNINYSNPASYSSLSKNSFVFDGGILSNSDNLSTTSLKQNNNYTCLNHLLFGFPITKWWASSFGLTPISRIGYNISSTSHDSIGDVMHQYEGSGGINQFYIGNAFHYKDFSIGVNSSYLFGYLNNTQTVYFPTDYGNYRNENRVNINKIRFTYGLQYEHTFIDTNVAKVKDTSKRFSHKFKHFTNGFTISFGLTYNNSVNIVANENTISGHPVSFNDGTLDTINTNQSNKAIIKLPQSIGAGIILKKENVFLIGFDYQWTNWSQFYDYSNYSMFGKNDAGIADNWNAGVGLQIYLKKNFPFRVGYRYESAMLTLNNQKIESTIFTLGCGIPFYNKVAKSVTFINIGLEFGKRGTMSDNLIKDNFVRATIGVTIFEKWFTKSKYF